MAIHGSTRTRQVVSGKATTTSVINGELTYNSQATRDYNKLINKPSIEGVELVGDKLLPDFGIPYVYYGTTEYWDNQPSLLTVDKAIYIYTDYRQDDDGNDIAGFKIGDGKGYLIDAPFIDKLYEDHIRNMIIHVTQEDKNRWDEKIRVYINPDNNENMVFTTESSYE